MVYGRYNELVNGGYFMVYKPRNITGPHPAEENLFWFHDIFRSSTPIPSPHERSDIFWVHIPMSMVGLYTPSEKYHQLQEKLSTPNIPQQNTSSNMVCSTPN